ncbi:MAG: hypothetical protein R3245_07445 [Kiloniellales bacterium]|nr:hypothetical protein [Kiloniellales bacterium]
MASIITDLSPIIKSLVKIQGRHVTTEAGSSDTLASSREKAGKAFEMVLELASILLLLLLALGLFWHSVAKERKKHIQNRLRDRQG